jgi:hypothetical protein
VSDRRRAGRFYGVAAALAAIIAVALHVTWAPAITTIGPTPSAHASVTFTSSTDNLSAGDSIHFHVDTSPNGQTAVTLASVEAHVCKTGFTTYSVSSFGYNTSAGVRCVNGANITSGGLTSIEDGYKLGPVPFSAVTTSGDLVFHAGTGTVGWTNASGFPSGPITCDDANVCDLVLRVGLVGDVVFDTFFIQPLTFAGGTTTTTGDTTTTTGDPTTTTGGGSTTTTSASTTTTHATTTTSPTTTTHATTTTTHATTTTSPTTTTHATTTTTGSSSTTTTTSGSGSGGTVEPSTVAPGGQFTVSSTGWKDSSTVTASLQSQSSGTSSTTTTTTSPGSTTTTHASALGSRETGTRRIQLAAFVQQAATTTPLDLGALTADASGKVQGQFTLPADLATGNYVIVLSGKSPNDSARTVNLNLTVSTTTGSTTTTIGSATGANNGSSAALSPTTASGPSLAITGSWSRNLASIALLSIALGLYLLSRQSRRQAAVDRP